jgi:hypothetical protein
MSSAEQFQIAVGINSIEADVEIECRMEGLSTDIKPVIL